MKVSLGTLLADVEGALISGDPAMLISGIAYDSRKVVPGGLFVAVKGHHVDGHAYVSQARARGAAALVVDARYWNGDGAPTTAPRPPSTIAIVPNSLAALAPIAAAFYSHPGRELAMVGVTGTKGKSTTSDLIAQLFDASGRSSGLISTVDFKIGARRWANDTRQSTPEAPEVQAMLREMVTAGCDVAVVEATSHALSAGWNRLGGCAFDVAVMLNVTHEHLDFHGSLDQYRADKARLFEMLGEDDGRSAMDDVDIQGLPSTVIQKAQKWAIVNADDPAHQFFLDAAPASARRLSFAIDSPADVRGYDLDLRPSGSQLRVATAWGEAELRLGLPGRFNVYNGLAALSVALSQGVDLAQATAALGQVRGVRGRMEPVRVGQPFDVIVDYAHNPDSFEQVFSLLRPLTKGRIIAVFGSAGERDIEKRPIQGAIAAKYCDLLVLTDEDPRAEDRESIIAAIAAGAAQVGKRPGAGYRCIADRSEAVRAALADAQPGDLVLLLGKGHEGSIIYDGYSIAWDEAAVARAALGELGYAG